MNYQQLFYYMLNIWIFPRTQLFISMFIYHAGDLFFALVHA